LGDGAGGGHAFGDEDHAVKAALALGVEMVFAVAQLGDAQADGLGAFAGELLDALELLAEGAGFLDLLDEDLGGVGVAVEEVGDDVADLRDEVGADFGVAELVLGLRLEDGSLRRMAMAPTMDSRTSSPSNLALANSLTPLRKPSRKAERWVPPSVVNWPLTKEKKVSLKRWVWVKAISRAGERWWRGP
jgi:hypothetical protein